MLSDFLLCAGDRTVEYYERVHWRMQFRNPPAARTRSNSIRKKTQRYPIRHFSVKTFPLTILISRVKLIRELGMSRIFGIEQKSSSSSRWRLCGTKTSNDCLVCGRAFTSKGPFGPRSPGTCPRPRFVPSRFTELVCRNWVILIFSGQKPCTNCTRIFYCAFHKHANSEVQKPTGDYVFHCRQSS